MQISFEQTEECTLICNDTLFDLVVEDECWSKDRKIYANREFSMEKRSFLNVKPSLNMQKLIIKLEK